MDQKIDISIVIPAYNESKRLPRFLDRVVAFCERSHRVYEIIVVDDGSSDGTLQVANSYIPKYPHFSTIKLYKNRGKGYAVKRGLLKARGEVCLFLDADGSTQPEEIEKNLHYIESGGFDIFVGSRVLHAPDVILKAKWYRKWVGRIFNFCVRKFLFSDVQDTQCGFKMFKKNVVAPLFSRSHLRGFGFDIEILFLAHKMGYKVKEGAVSWHFEKGSKVNLISDSVKMFVNILQIRNWHYTPINTKSKYMGPNEYKFMYDMEERHWWFVSHRYLFLKLIGRLKLHTPSILDVGAGTGAKLQALNKLGRTAGIDASMRALVFCKKRGLDNVVQGVAEKLPFEDRQFDILLYSDILEHLENPVEALKEGRRVLKDSGKIIITVPAFKLLWSQHDEALCHFRRYEKKTLLIDLKEAGLQPNKMSYLFFTSFFLVAPVRIIRRFTRRFNGKFKSDTTTLPPAALNWLLVQVFKLEVLVASSVGLPFGTTLFAVVSKE